MFDDHDVTRRQFSNWLVGMAATASLTKSGFGQPPAHVLRIALSMDTLAGANVNDARAAYRVWTREIIKSMAVSVELVPDIFIPSEQMIRMIKQGSIDMFGITAWEYAKVVDFLDPVSLFVEDYIGDGMEYVLLVHKASPFNKLADLQGAQLTTHHHRDMNLAPVWLGELLAANNLPRMDLFFSNQLLRDNVAQVVLPVFFRRMDAACLARKHFETAVEMNPQLGRDLLALAISPKLVPITLSFQKNCKPADKELLIGAISRMSTLTAGQQIVALYQSRTLVLRPVSCMDVTLDLLHRYARVTAHPPGQRKQ